jgi:hypothetical protein
MPGVSPVGLRALTAALQATALNHLAEMHLGTDPVRLLGQKPPAGRRLQRDLETLAPKPGQEPADPGAVSRRDPRTRDLPGDRVDPLRRESARDADPFPSPASYDHHPFTSPNVNPHASAHSHAGSASHTVNHGRYLLFDWPAARPQSARAYDAVRREGPATLTAGITQTGT